VKLDLAGKTAVVTGASRGIGLEITRALVSEGVAVAAGALNGSAELTALADASDMTIVLDDLTTAAGCQTLVDQAVARFGGIDLLVNNVGGVHPRTQGFLQVADADWLARGAGAARRTAAAPDRRLQEGRRATDHT
jgi:NAD(P)-dependent dehydrogenase (short-subunit alcohol dehydrogenase family)